MVSIKAIEPQFILWVPEKQIFRKAEIRMPEHPERDIKSSWYDLTYDLMKNSQLNGDDIHLESLELLASASFGPIKIFDEQSESQMDYLTFRDKRRFKNDVAKKIVNLAGELAKVYQVPYFSVIVPPETEVDFSFPEREDPWAKLRGQYPIGVHLYPTAQLYKAKTIEKGSFAS